MKRLRIGMIDADLLDGGTRHPNLAQMKISAFCKRKKHSVELLFGEALDRIYDYDAIIVSKVFSYTNLPECVENLMGAGKNDREKFNTCVKESVEALENSPPPQDIKIMIGGTGFFPDGGRDLHSEIEHIMPDYQLYVKFIDYMVKERGKRRSYYKDYEEYSIGFTTRGCHRRCDFCVNKKYKAAFKHSPVSEFLDKSRYGIYLWDDNILSFKEGRGEILDELIQTGKPFQFRQGLDIRLLDEEVAYKLAHSKYHGDFIFAFDYYERDKDIICEKLKLWRTHCDKETKLYVLCAYEPQKVGNEGSNERNAAELADIVETFKRIKIIMGFGCLPYIMRYEAYKRSSFKGMYVELARWCNQPRFFKKMSFREFCTACQNYHKNKDTKCSSYNTMKNFEKDHPNIAELFFDLKFEKYNPCRSSPYDTSLHSNTSGCDR